MLVLFSFSFLQGSSLIINEFSKGNTQWVEIYNKSGRDIILDGWKLLNSTGEDAIHGMVKSHGYVVVVASKDGFSEFFPALSLGSVIEVADGSIGSGLRGDSDMLALLDPDGNLSDCLNWGTPDPGWKNFNSFIWIPGILREGDFLARFPNGQDTDSPSDFHPTSRPTPGSTNIRSSGLDATSWGKIKALFSDKRRG